MNDINIANAFRSGPFKLAADAGTTSKSLWERMPIMLRKELRLGLTIGGVILAVVVVWVIAVSGSSDKKQARDETRQVDIASNTSSSTDAARQGDAGRVTLEPVAHSDQQATSTTQPGGATASNDASSSKGDLDWGKLLNGDQPMLMQSTPTAPNAQKPAEATPVPQPAPAADTQTPAPATPSPAADSTTPAPATAQPLPGPAQHTTADPSQPAPELPTAPQQNQQVAINTQETGPQQTTILPPPTVTEPQVMVDPPMPGSVSVESKTSAAGKQRTHVVQKNETLSTISTAAYGNANYYPHILRANPGLDPKRMKVGTTIVLPDVASVKPEATVGAGAEQKASATSTPQLDATKEYKVQPNDSLYKISQKLYGKSDLSNKIYELNKDTIGPDPAKLKLGTILKLPSAPTVAQSH